MNITALTCPNCGANIDLIDGKNISFCQYCGSKLAIDDGTKHEYIHHVDEAKIKKYETEVERTKTKAEAKEQARKHQLISCLIVFALGMLMFAIAGILSMFI